jgi:hypothetical protein
MLQYLTLNDGFGLSDCGVSAVFAIFNWMFYRIQMSNFLARVGHILNAPISHST